MGAWQEITALYLLYALASFWLAIIVVSQVNFNQIRTLWLLVLSSVITTILLGPILVQTEPDFVTLPHIVFEPLLAMLIYRAFAINPSITLAPFGLYDAILLGLVGGCSALFINWRFKFKWGR